MYQELNWVKRFQQHRLSQDTGHNVMRELKTSPLRLKLLLFCYHPYTELFSFFLILFSVTVLITEMTHPEGTGVGWMNSDFDNQERRFFLLADLVITIFFAVEYVVKLFLVNHKKEYFISTIIDLLAILPLFRVFRLARTLRFLKMFRLIRALKMDSLMEYEIVRKKSATLFQTEGTTTISYLIISVLFGTFGILIFERGANDGFNSLEDGLWWCIVTITTVGYGDISPITTGGKIVAIIIMFVGLSFYALLTGTISTVLIDRAKHYKEKKMEISLLENHIIICGWNDDAYDLVENLLKTSTRYILIITPDEIPYLEGRRILFKQGDPSDNEVLKNVMIEAAHSVVVLSVHPENSSHQDVDARSILVTLAIKLCNPDLHTIIELQNPNNIQHAKNAGANEFITPHQYKGSILAQSASSPGVAKVFATIFGDKDTYFYHYRIEEELIGMEYIDAIKEVIEADHSPIGILRQDKPILAPSPFLPLEEGDLLIFLHAPKPEEPPRKEKKPNVNRRA